MVGGVGGRGYEYEDHNLRRKPSQASITIFGKSSDGFGGEGIIHSYFFEKHEHLRRKAFLGL